MKKLMMGMVLSLFATSPLFALLSPLDQSLTEIKAIIDSPELRKNLMTSETIQDIWKVGNRYVISTENRQMAVQITYSSRNTPGPQEFNLQFSTAKPFGE